MADPGGDFIAGYERQPSVAVVEGDRLCRGCGYVLRGQHIRREPHTGMLLCRCPECGGFASAHDYVPAGQVWLRRLAGPAVVLWVGVILCILGFLAFALWIDLLVFTEFIIEREWNHTTRKSSRFVTDLDQPEEVFGMALIVLVAALCGLLSTAVLTVVAPHWRRAGYVAAACVVPALAYAAFEITLWAGGAPNFIREFVGVIRLGLAALLCVPVVSGLTMAWLGRPLARLLIRLFVPPKLRPPLAYLWLTDGKPLPPGGCPIPG